MLFLSFFSFFKMIADRTTSGLLACQILWHFRRLQNYLRFVPSPLFFSKFVWGILFDMISAQLYTKNFDLVFCLVERVSLKKRKRVSLSIFPLDSLRYSLQPDNWWVSSYNCYDIHLFLRMSWCLLPLWRKIKNFKIKEE